MQPQKQPARKFWAVQPTNPRNRAVYFEITTDLKGILTATSEKLGIEVYAKNEKDLDSQIRLTMNEFYGEKNAPRRRRN